MKVLRASTMTEISRVHAARDDWDDAGAMATQAAQLAKDAGNPVEVAEAQLILAQGAASRGRDAQAVCLVRAALVAFRERGIVDKLAEAATEIGMILLAKRRKAAAADLLGLAANVEKACKG